MKGRSEYDLRQAFAKSKLAEMELLHGTFYPSYSSPFPTGFLASGLVFNGHGMHV